MLIVSQNENKITESLEFDIKEIQTCKNIFIDEKSWQRFKKITQKKNDIVNLKEMKGLEEFLGQDMRKTIHSIIEVKTKRVFALYTTKEKAKNTLKEIIQAYRDRKKYQLKRDNDIGIVIL